VERKHRINRKSRQDNKMDILNSNSEFHTRWLTQVKRGQKDAAVTSTKSHFLLSSLLPIEEMRPLRYD
jgi:hypothetical protein